MSLSTESSPRTLPTTLKAWFEGFFYGNYFYGICIVSIMLETVVHLQLELGGSLLYLMAFLVTVLFYNYPYIMKKPVLSNNPRTMWFVRNHRFVVANQLSMTLVLVLCFGYLAFQQTHNILHFGLANWLLLLVFPLTGALYYGLNRLSPRLNLRQIGWLKPFLIGFVWAGLANVYPILYANLIHDQPLAIAPIPTLLFVKTLMYCSMLAIMFDIKDYDADQKLQLKTWIVRFGLHTTLSYVIVPLTLLGLLIFVAVGLIREFSFLRMALIMIPFIALIAATQLFKKKRSLIFYLTVIDGLLIVKAVFGILAMYV